MPICPATGRSLPHPLPMILKELQSRSSNACELCTATENLGLHIVAPKMQEALENTAYLCTSCQSQIAEPETADTNHWRCLNDSMWSTEPAVQVLAWRMLNHLKGESWPQDLLDMMYMDEETLSWAKSGYKDLATAIKHRDSNGVQLKNGDDVVLIKDLDVKGANFTAKRGTAVKRVSLVHDNEEHIEGKVDGQHIVILTKYVKKQ